MTPRRGEYVEVEDDSKSSKIYYARIYRWDLASPEVRSLTPCAFHVWVILKAHVFTGGGYSVSYEALQDFTGRGRRTVQRAIDELENAEMLSKHYRNDKKGDQMPNLWKLHDPPSVEAALSAGVLPQDYPQGWCKDHQGGRSRDHARVVLVPAIHGGADTTLQGKETQDSGEEDVVEEGEAPVGEQRAPHNFRPKGRFSGLFKRSIEQIEAEVLQDLSTWATSARDPTPRDVEKWLQSYHTQLLTPEYRRRVMGTLRTEPAFDAKAGTPRIRALRHALSSGWKRSCRVALQNVVSIVNARLCIIEKGDSKALIRELRRFRMEAA